MKKVYNLFWIALIASIFLSLPSCQPAQHQSTQIDDVLKRSEVGGALKRTVSRIQRESGEWPKSLTSFRSAPELANYQTDLADAAYDLVRVDGTNAIFRFRFGTHESEVTVGEARESQGTPTMSGATPTGG